MLRAILIDDEILSLESLEMELQSHCPDVEIIEICKGAKAGKEAIVQHHPDLVFLDLEMPGQNGFELLEEVKYIPFDVIFTTAYDEYAIRAIKVSAMDYLLKPIDIDELKQAVKKISEKTYDGLSRQKLDVLLTNIQGSHGVFEKLAVPTLSGLSFINLSDIVYCEADGNYTTVFTANGDKYVLSKTLKETEGLMSNPVFFRTHQSYLVNLNCIQEYIKGPGGQLVMQDGSIIQVARARKESLMQLIYRK
jgi:two-component system LytT family response regulator